MRIVIAGHGSTSFHGRLRLAPTAPAPARFRYRAATFLPQSPSSCNRSPDGSSRYIQTERYNRLTECISLKIKPNDL
jgi:hypothetical protein